mmetsp:Transcript_33952/g.44797  ORF Transcript_33952/g.44797 Transcript_33952/m.44797 type:complete len:101 (+) Transcript_33952:137-439(+)
MPLISWSDPITVSITLLILTAPIGLIWTTICRLVFIAVTQPHYKDRNILFIIAKPSDIVRYFQPGAIGLRGRNKMQVLCFSNGANPEDKNDGKKRESELV